MVIHQLIDFPSETLRKPTPANSPEPTLLNRSIEAESPKRQIPTISNMVILQTQIYQQQGKLQRQQLNNVRNNSQ
jgi:hypothetical protein